MEQSVSSGQIPPVKQKLRRLTGRTKTRFAMSTPTMVCIISDLPGCSPRMVSGRRPYHLPPVVHDPLVALLRKLKEILRVHGYACEVIAPAKIACRPGDRIKTDRRDALLLARAARAGELVSISIPDERDEALLTRQICLLYVRR